MSAPAAKERRLLAQRSKRRMAPEIKAANPKAMVKGKRSWLELVRARVWMNGWAIGRRNMRSGEVRTARNGSTAPMLRISAKEAAIIKISSIANWALRRGDICVQRRESKLEMDIERKVLREIVVCLVGSCCFWFFLHTSCISVTGCTGVSFDIIGFCWFLLVSVLVKVRNIRKKRKNSSRGRVIRGTWRLGRFVPLQWFQGYYDSEMTLPFASFTMVLVLVVFPLASFTSTTVWVPPSVSGVTLVVVDETGAPESVVTVSVVTVAVPVVVGVDAVVVVCTLPFGSVVVVGGDTTVGPIGGAGGAGGTTGGGAGVFVTTTGTTGIFISELVLNPGAVSAKSGVMEKLTRAAVSMPVDSIVFFMMVYSNRVCFYFNRVSKWKACSSTYYQARTIA